MNKEGTLKILEIMKAYSEDKVIQSRSNMRKDEKWVDCPFPSWNFDSYEYRIKPDDEYRPYANMEEFLTAQRVHGPYIKALSEEFFMVDRVQHDRVGWRKIGTNGENWLTYEELLRNCYHWQDGTICGVKEDEE